MAQNAVPNPISHIHILNPHMSYTILFPSSSLVVLTSRPIGQMPAFFHHVPHLDDIKRRGQDMLLSHQVKATLTTKRSTFPEVQSEIEFPVKRKFGRPCYILCIFI